MNTDTAAAEEPSYILALEGEGITIKREITRDTALAIINVALGGGSHRGGGSHGGGTGGGTDPTGQSGSVNPSGRVTAGEYIESVEAGTNPEKITAFGVFLEQTRGQENFTRDDIKAMFRAAHEPAPANFGRDFRAALSSNWIASEDDSTDRYFVTATGKKAVEKKFTSKPARKPRRKGGSSLSSAGDEE